jgi:excisionase family DNA binding protein
MCEVSVTERLFTIADVAALLHVDRSTVSRLLSTDKLACYKVSRRRL